MGCDCLCPVTPQGGVLWHAEGQFPASTVAPSPGKKIEMHLKKIVKRD